MRRRFKLTLLLMFILVMCLGLSSCLEQFYTNIKDKFSTNQDDDDDKKQDDENTGDENKDDDDEEPADPNDPGNSDPDPGGQETPSSTEITVTSISINNEGFLLTYTSDKTPKAKNFTGRVVFTGVFNGNTLKYTCTDVDISFEDESAINVKVGTFISDGTDVTNTWSTIYETLGSTVVDGLYGTATIEFKLIDAENDKIYTYIYEYSSEAGWQLQ